MDLDVQVEGEGILALCKGCIGEAAEAAGLHLNGAAIAEERAAFQEERRQFDPEAVETLKAEIAERDLALEVANGVIAALRPEPAPNPYATGANSGKAAKTK